jgi:pyruvate formate lyase activating enzyme
MCLEEKARSKNRRLKENLRPLIVDIRRESLEDGPGMRSVVFFKGCPLRCAFCHNPEAQSPEPEISFSPRACIRCGKCAEVCPHGAADIDFDSRIHRDKCDGCAKCAEACPNRGLRLVGTYHDPESLAKVMLQDISFYEVSGGGVTLSGGEPTLYPDYVETLLKILKARNIHIVLQTSGYFDFAEFERKILPYISLVYFDFKFADSELHREYTGEPNGKILENFRRLLSGKEVGVQPRIPVIPGVTATKENLASIVDFLCDAGAESVSLLPYNPMGMEMYPSLGKPKPPLPDRFLKPEEEKELTALFESILRETGARTADKSGSR